MPATICGASRRATASAARRVDEVLELVGIGRVARQRVGRFSLGMRQRLGIAAALLGDPDILMFDEPLNGLDPEGIRWTRGLLRSLAARDGRVLVSSHLMSEMALTADHLIVIGKGLIADTAIADLVGDHGRSHVVVRSAQEPRLAALLSEHGAAAVPRADGGLAVTGLESETIGELAASHQIAVYELSARSASLEEVFMELTADSIQYQAATDPRERS